MIVFANILGAVASIVDGVLFMYTILIIARVVVSWVNADPYNPIVRFITSMTDPVMLWLRRKFPFLTIGMLDLSPIVLLLLISFLRIALVQSLADYAQLYRLRSLQGSADSHLSIVLAKNSFVERQTWLL
jgi:YggT family protein